MNPDKDPVPVRLPPIETVPVVPSTTTTTSTMAPPTTTKASAVNWNELSRSVVYIQATDCLWTGSGTIVLLAWSIVFKVEETIVLPGEISTRNPAVQLAALDPGRVIAVLVKPYQFVNKGDKILIYSDDETPLRLSSLVSRKDLILSDVSVVSKEAITASFDKLSFTTVCK